MKIGICDDEQEGIQLLSRWLRQAELPEETVFKAYTPSELLFDLQEDFFDCDIILMDIYYKGLDFNGIHAAEQINALRPPCQVIFISNYVEYAESVYDTNHIYFIRKEHAGQLLQKALNKAIHKIENKEDDLLTVRSEGRQLFLRSWEILYVSRDNRCILIHTKNGAFKSTMSLNELVRETEPLGILRIHGSYLVNLQHIEQLLPNQVILSDGTALPVGGTFSTNLRQEYLRFFDKNV